MIDLRGEIAAPHCARLGSSARELPRPAQMSYIGAGMFAAKAVLALLLSLLLYGAPAAALTIRGDYDWVSSPACPEGWQSPEYNDRSWTPVAYPWLLIWPSPWEPDSYARPFWDANGVGTACTRRSFDLPRLPKDQAVVHVFVDDDYELWLNGHLVARNLDQAAERPGESYDVSSLLKTGRNVIGLKIIDVSYEKGAFFSLEIPGVPQESRSWKAWSRLLRPWVEFGLLVAAFLAGALGLRWLMARMTQSLARWPAWVVAPLSLALAVGCQIVLQSGDLYVAPPEQPWAEWQWHMVAIAAVLFLGLVSLRPADAATDEAGPLRGEYAWLAAILALAAVLRIYDIDHTPVGFYQDEATNGLDALQLMSLDGVSIWSDSVGGRPTLFLYLLGFCLQIFGVSYLSLKILPIALSIASVAAVYALARIGLGGRTALWAAFFLAVSRWHIHYARMAWEVNCVPFFSAAGFALLLDGLRREQGGERNIVAGAALLSAGLYTYAAYRAVPAAAAVFLLWWFVAGDRPERRHRMIAVARAGLAAIIVALPLAAFALVQPGRYWERYNDVSLTYYISYYGTPIPWLHQLGKGFLSLNSIGDDLIRHNLPHASQLDPITGVFFLLGLTTAARPWQRTGARLLWAWFIVFLALASLTRDAPHATRYLGLVVPAVLFAGLGAARLFARLRRVLRFAPLAWLLVAATVTAATGVNAYQYFVLEANDPNSDFEMNVIARSICERVRAKGKVKVYWTSDVAYWAGGPCYFLTKGKVRFNDIKPEDLSAAKLGQKGRGATLFFIGPELLEPERKIVKRDDNDLPILGLAGIPEIQRDRQGRLLYYIWDVEK